MRTASERNILAIKVAYNDPDVAGMGVITSGHGFVRRGALIPGGLRVRLSGEKARRVSDIASLAVSAPTAAHT